jgi:hypothetical protein
VYGFNMSSIRQVAITEPLVDVVDRGQVVTDNVNIKVSTGWKKEFHLKISSKTRKLTFTR